MSHCICGKHMLQFANEGTCLWCGHGSARQIAEQAFRLNMVANTSPLLDARAVPAQSNGRRGGRQAEWDEMKVIQAARDWQKAKGKLPRSTDWMSMNGGPPHPTYSVVRRLFGGWPGFMHAIAEVPREQEAA